MNPVGWSAIWQLLSQTHVSFDSTIPHLGLYCICKYANWSTWSQWLSLKELNESHSVVSDSWWPHGLYRSWNSPGQNTGEGSLSLLQGIFLTRGLNPGLPHCMRILYQLSHKGSTREATKEGLKISNIPNAHQQGSVKANYSTCGHEWNHHAIIIKNEGGISELLWGNLQDSIIKWGKKRSIAVCVICHFLCLYSKKKKSLFFSLHAQKEVLRTVMGDRDRRGAFHLNSLCFGFNHMNEVPCHNIWYLNKQKQRERTVAVLGPQPCEVDICSWTQPGLGGRRRAASETEGGSVPTVWFVQEVNSQQAE